MAALDLRAMALGLFLPILYWTGAVVAITLFGYPGVVCMTPAAWLLALPVGLRVHRESVSPGSRPVLEAAFGGGLLGFWQGLLVPAVMTASRYIPGQTLPDPPDPIFAALLVILIGMPVTAGLAAMMVFLVRRRSEGNS